MPDKKLERLWYVLHTKSRHEKVVDEGLKKKSIEVYLPKVTMRSKRRDRKMMIRVPLFPGYLFVKTDLQPSTHLEIVKTVGAVRLIGNKQGPVSVPDDTVESLKIMVAGDHPVLDSIRAVHPGYDSRSAQGLAHTTSKERPICKSGAHLWLIWLACGTEYSEGAPPVGTRAAATGTSGRLSRGRLAPSPK